MRSLSFVKGDQRSPASARSRVRESNLRSRVPWPILATSTWTGAALGIYGVEKARASVDLFSVTELGWIRIAIILAAAALFARLSGGISVDTAAATGLAWLIYSIAADVITGLPNPAGTWGLLVEPLAQQPIGDLTVLVWLAAPVLFARSAGPASRTGLLGSDR